MKIQPFLLTMVTILWFSLTSFGQIQNSKDGYGFLHMDAKVKELKKMLVPVKDEDLWKPEAKDDYITSSFLINLKKFKIKDYFGLKIKRIEVHFDGEWDEHGVPQNEDVFSFHFFLEKPKNKKALGAYKDAVLTHYGPMRSSPVPDADIEPPYFWFTRLTMLYVNFGQDMETGEDTDFFEVDFVQGYGG